MGQKQKRKSTRNNKNENHRKRTPFTIVLIRFLFKNLGSFFPSFAARKALNIFMTPKRRKEGALPTIFDKAYVMGTPHKNAKIRSYMWGQTGKIVLLVHGWESSSRIFEAFILPLVNAGYRVVAIDGPAHADSILKQTNMVDFGDALYTVVQRLEKSGGVYAMVGHSFGGSSIINMFRRRSKPRSIKKLVLIAIPERIDHVFYSFFKFLQIPERVNHAFKNLMLEEFNLNIEDLRVKNWINNLGLEKAMIIHDREDKIISYKEAELLSNSWSGSKLLLTEGLGHNRIMKNEEVIGEITTYFKEGVLVEDTEIGVVI